MTGCSITLAILADVGPEVDLADMSAMLSLKGLVLSYLINEQICQEVIVAGELRNCQAFQGIFLGFEFRRRDLDLSHCADTHVCDVADRR